MEQLAKAIIKVMQDVRGVEKNSNVGTGHNSYKGVGDKDVKVALRTSMAANGLCIIPISVSNDTKIERWTEEDPKYGTKNKQQVFTEVKTRYMLLHDSGQHIELEGFGHGVDTQDKSAGKATTYALKYALLYLFMVPTGDIDDSDNDHSDTKPVPGAGAKSNRTATPAPAPAGQQVPEKPWLNPGTEQWGKVITALNSGYTMNQIEAKYRISKPNREKLLEEAAQ